MALAPNGREKSKSHKITMETDELRRRFLDFFKKRGHTVVRSDSLVPQNDPTLLFTSAGMNPFKDYFLGLKKDLKRAASSQKCLRTGDLDEVGRTPYHHSFFEMLGNFSFGDYFKEDAIQWAWEFLTEELKLSKERLRVSVHKDDNEAYKLWHDKIKVPEKWIYKLGDKTNFWPSNAPKDGPNGPCGPCSEIYYDQEPNSRSEDIEGSRFAEIWNLVFTQFDRQEGGKLVPLKQKNIDTGMGLERLACVMQGKKTNFEIDIFRPVNEAINRCFDLKFNDHEVRRGNQMLYNTSVGIALYRQHLYSIADHARAVIFAITDGVIPSNEGRGYVIRKLIRRALYRAHLMTLHNLTEPFLYKLTSSVAETMKTYPEAREAAKSVSDTILGEEERFLKTLELGLSLLVDKIEKAKQKGLKRLSGEEVFLLYDTYGFPDELTHTIAKEEGFEIDQTGFDRLMDEQRKRAKGASEITEGIFVTSELDKRLHELPATKFLGYDAHQGKGKVLLAQMEQDKGIIVLDQTPFYGESGGQVGDQGVLKGDGFEAKVEDTQKKDSYHLHYVRVLKGRAKEGMTVEASIDSKRRDSAMRNHTATHLLHAVLREVLGNQVRQVGSLVHPDRLRFDYSFGRALTPEEFSKIEMRVNEEILKDTPLKKEEKGFDEAKSEGAIAFFGEKYGDRVRVVSVPGISKEFCGGTHCDRTGQIGAFVITGDFSIASGVRRMEALTGEGALRYIQTLRSQVQQAAERLKATPSELVDRIEKLQERAKKLEKEGRSKPALEINPKEALEKAERVGPFRLITERFEEASREDLRRVSDQLRSQAKQSLWLLSAKGEEKAHFLVGLSADLKNGALDAREIVGEIGKKVGGSGGGRKDLAEGGGLDLSVLENSWKGMISSLKNYLEQKT